MKAYVVLSCLVSCRVVLSSLQPSGLGRRQESLRLGELALHLMKASGKMLSDGSVEVSTVLTACTLDDLRTGMQRVTSR